MTHDHFMANGQPTHITMASYRDWFARNERIGTLKTSIMEYCVGKLLNGLESPYGALYRIGDVDDQLTEDGIVVGIRWTEWTGSTDASVRNDVSFPLRFGKWPDVVLFGMHDTSDRYHQVLDLDAWDFYSVPGNRLRERYGGSEQIQMQDLLKLSPVWSDYNGIPEAIQKALDA